MIDHASLHVSDIARSTKFYSDALKPIGYSVIMELPEWSVAGLGAGGKADLWLKGGESKQPSHLAFGAQSKKEVDEFYKAAIEAGGKDNGAPGYRKEYNPGYYGAFILDPDGHNIEVVFHDPVPSP